ncbi:MAG TPA: hypothetical protein VJV97_02870 [Gemmatimonadaceae bacterium]|nr:hypothetical protein [Gemmatimonadaceae bacterium]
MANIDRADWHYGGNYPAGLPPENAGTHIGMYLAWIVHRNLGSKELAQLSGDTYSWVLSREVTGRDLLFTKLDEKFFYQLLSPEGEAFTRSYYESNGYANDYDRVLGADLPSLYHVKDTWENFDKLAPVLDERLAAWRALNKAPIDPLSGE